VLALEGAKAVGHLLPALLAAVQLDQQLEALLLGALELLPQGTGSPGLPLELGPEPPALLEQLLVLALDLPDLLRRVQDVLAVDLGQLVLLRQLGTQGTHLQLGCLFGLHARNVLAFQLAFEFPVVL
jgi:hypothetical protein